jgi:hypothetical protein
MVLTQVLKYANRCDLVEASLEIAVGAIRSGEQPVYGTGKETSDTVCLVMIVSKQWSECARALCRSGRLVASNTVRVLWLLVTVSGHVAAPEPRSDNTLLQQGYAYMYNLQFDAAHRVLHQYEQIHPNDPMGPVSDAAAYLFYAFDELKLLRSDRFLDDQKFLSATKSNADPRTTQAFKQALRKGHELVENALHNSPSDKNAFLANVFESRSNRTTMR